MAYTSSETVLFPNIQAATFEITITADEKGIKEGDVALLQVVALAPDLVQDPLIGSITDSLGNTWTVDVMDYYLAFPGGGKSQIMNIASGVMAAPVSQGRTFTITVTMYDTGLGFPYIQIASFVNVGGVGSLAAETANGRIVGTAATWSSGASTSLFEQTGFYVSLAGATNSISAIPSGFTPTFSCVGITDGVWPFAAPAFVQAASFANTAPNLVNDTWTQSPAGGYTAALYAFTYPTTPSPSGDVVTDICERAGLLSSQIDVSLLTNANIQPNTTVQGYLIEQPRSAAEILKVLMQAYFFDGCESDGAMRWIPRGLAPAMSIPESDLGLLEDQAKLEESLAQSQDLPLQFTVIYNDPVLDYQQGKQLKARTTRIVKTQQNVILQIPMTMDENWAMQVAEKALYLAWLERSAYKFNLWRALYLMLDPTDVIQFVYEGLTFTARITENTLGQGFVVEIRAANENQNNYLSSAVGGTVQGYTPATLTIVAPTQLFLLDIALLEDTDSNPSGTGFYFACGSSVPDWAGAVLYGSNDNSTFPDQIATDRSPVTFGYATTTLGAPREPWEWDAVNTLTVALVSGSFSGDTQLNVLNGSNQIVVGSEVVQFQNAIQNSDGTWTISMLLRGRRGTEAACGTHSANELVLLVPSGVQREAEPLSELGLPGYYKAVTVGMDITTAGSQELTIAGNDLKPYAPVGIGGTVDGSGDIAITWVRRTRIGGEADWADGVANVPVSEDAELYDVDILNGSSVVRTFSNVTAPTVIYTAAQQTTDFGSTQSSVTVNVYQVSGEVGRGNKGVGVAPTLSGWPIPWPATDTGTPGGGGTGEFYVNGS